MSFSAEIYLKKKEKRKKDVKKAKSFSFSAVLLHVQQQLPTFHLVYDYFFFYFRVVLR